MCAGELVPPWLSTITYLTDHGAPTLILPAVPDVTGEAVSEGLGAYVSYPLGGKHLAFDGRLLHGCPHVLAMRRPGGGGGGGGDGLQQPGGGGGGGKGALRPGGGGEGGLRLTLLVNLWRGHTPISPKRLTERVATEMGMGEEEKKGEAVEEEKGGAAAVGGLLLAQQQRADGDGGGDQCAPFSYVVDGEGKSGGGSGGGGGEAEEEEEEEEVFAPSESRRRLSPAARAVRVRSLPSGAALATAGAIGARVVHAPNAAVVLQQRRHQQHHQHQQHQPGTSVQPELVPPAPGAPPTGEQAHWPDHNQQHQVDTSASTSTTTSTSNSDDGDGTTTASAVTTLEPSEPVTTLEASIIVDTASLTTMLTEDLLVHLSNYLEVDDAIALIQCCRTLHVHFCRATRTLQSDSKLSVRALVGVGGGF